MSWRREAGARDHQLGSERGRRLLRPLRNERVDRRVVGERHGGVVPGLHHQRPLGQVQKRKGCDRLVGVGEGRVDQVAEVAGHPLDRRAIEEIGVVFPRGAQAVCQFREGEQHVELRGAAIDLHGAERQTGQRLCRHRQVLERQSGLEERRVAHLAAGLDCVDEHLERHVLVGVRAKGGLTGAANHLAEGRLTVKLRPEDERVDEEADEQLQLRPVAAGDHRTDRDVTLTRVAGEKRLVGGQEDHVERGAFRSRQRVEPLLLFRTQAEGVGRTVRRLHRGPGPVRGQVEAGGDAGKLLLPVVQLGLQRRDAIRPVSFQPRPLPRRKVGVLRRQRGQAGLGARLPGLHERRPVPRPGCRATSRRPRCDARSEWRDDRVRPAGRYALGAAGRWRGRTASGPRRGRVAAPRPRVPPGPRCLRGPLRGGRPSAGPRWTGPGHPAGWQTTSAAPRAASRSR